MRLRKRAESHDITVMKFRAWFVGQDNPHMLPDAVYNVARSMQDTWNDIAKHNEQEYEKWRSENPAPVAPENLSGEELKSWRKENPFPKPTKEFYAENERWTLQRIADARLPDELGQTLQERLQATFKRLKHGGGPPKPKHRLDRFSLHHRYAGGGLPVERVGGPKAERFRVTLPPASAYLPRPGKKNPRESRRQRLVPCWFRVAGEPLRLNVKMHQALPEGDVYLKRVAIVGKKPSQALEWEYHIVLTLETPKPQPRTGKVCGIEVGWRKINAEEMRIAVLYDGISHSELRVPLRSRHRTLGEVSLDRLSNIRQCRDNLLERTKKNIAPLFDSLPQGWVQVRNGGLVRLMRDSNTPEKILELLKKWKADNDYYIRLERLIEGNLRHHYDHAYQNWAKSVASQYSLVRIEEMNLRDLWDAKETDYGLRNSAERRKLAACGLFLEYLQRAVEKSGGTVEKVSAPHTTDVCSEHGTPFHAGRELLGRCEKMHKKDQDWNAAENIFASRGGFAEKASSA